VKGWEGVRVGRARIPWPRLTQPRAGGWLVPAVVVHPRWSSVSGFKLISRGCRGKLPGWIGANSLGPSPCVRHGELCRASPRVVPRDAAAMPWLLLPREGCSLAARPCSRRVSGDASEIGFTKSLFFFNFSFSGCCCMQRDRACGRL